ncbi:hypothetical protein HNQ59_000859 [Chitinivorax tropicus]|uniref:Uncharacterized protein n=1 Tax=Chitinivorax tropicus TaxID=714531 RepID=A0A840MGR5_9PROT|nr:hypothetical protein [Chitinivorax tropicus]
MSVAAQSCSCVEEEGYAKPLLAHALLATGDIARVN